MSLTKDDLKILSAPFDEKTIGIKVQSFSKDRTKAMLVAYVQHTDCYSRIETVDSEWSFHVTQVQPVGEGVFVRGILKIKGVSRENAGEGGDEKSAISDCIKRCAMLFGVGRYLYDSETVWVDYNEGRDRFRIWTFQDYKAALKRDQDPLPISEIKPIQTKPTEDALARSAIGREIVKTANKIGLNNTDMAEWVHDDFGKDMKSLSIQEMKIFLETLQRELGRQGA